MSDKRTGGVERSPCPCDACDEFALSEDEYCTKCLHHGCGPEPSCQAVTDGGTDADGVEQDDLRNDLIGNPYSLQDVDVGNEVWIPASLVRDGNCRAVKVRVVDRASLGEYEEENALDDWETDTESTGVERSGGGVR